MIGQEHYDTAKELLGDAGQIPANHDDTNPASVRTIAEAQVHATLAAYEALVDIASELSIIRKQHEPL